MGREEILLNLKMSSLKEIYIRQITDYIEKLSNHIKITGVLLFGSVARNKAHPIHSDIDIIIISPQFDIAPKEKTSLRIKLSKRLPSGIDAIWLGEKEIVSVFNAFTGMLLDALYEGIIIYDPKGILAKLRETLLKALRHGKIERIRGMWRLPVRRRGDKIELPPW